MKNVISLAAGVLFIVISSVDLLFAQGSKNVVYLSWKDVIEITKVNNLELQNKRLDYNIQELETWKSLSSFMPSLNYQGIFQRSIELPVFVFMGQRFTVGTPYNFQHSIVASLPLFTGGARWFNYDLQKKLRKSLKEELKGKEESVIYDAIATYYSVLLAKELIKTADEAVKVAYENLEQVKKFYNAGMATELDIQRARSQYSSTLPVLESALTNIKLSKQRLKSILNISLSDSLVINDTLEIKNFLNDVEDISLESLKLLSNENRPELNIANYQADASIAGEKLALSKFAPVVSLAASVDHAAPMENSKVQWKDYIRSKSIVLTVDVPLFEGGRRIIDWQIAKINSDKIEVMKKKTEYAVQLDVEQSYYNYLESEKNLKNLKDALDHAQESLRIARLLYSQGMSNQLDVLNAQLLYSKSKTEYLEGIYKYNLSQMSILKSAGILTKILN
ncbi:TolC family protein [Melioribacter sp. OK-6-Me]|uniref:TolC family protein n=1 Tax=unclassified Melioribacter TaxID=2627329 RepID=UPI003ED8468C